MFNRNLNGGSLFGNANTSTPTSTPTPGVNTFQLPQKSDNLFGGINSASVSTPSPSGGLFNNNNNSSSSAFNPTTQNSQASNGLFQSMPTNTIGNGGLFSNNSPSTNQNAASSLLRNGNETNTGNIGAGNSFGRSSSSGPTAFSFGTNKNTGSAGGLFTSGSSNRNPGSMFSNNQTTQSEQLFGNKQTNGANSSTGFLNDGSFNPTQPPINATSAISNPYGLNFSNVPISVSNMPASITASSNSQKPYLNGSSRSTDNAPSTIGSSGRRTYSVSSTASSNFTPPASLPPTSQSSLINKLSARLKTAQNVAFTQGIFSPSHNKPWTLQEQGTASSPAGSEFTDGNASNSNFVSIKGLSSFSLQKGDLSDMRKLKIDPSRSTAKKLKLLSGKPTTTKIHNTEEKKSHEINLKEAKSPTLASNKSSSDADFQAEIDKKFPQDDSQKELLEDHHPEIEVCDYWCSPPTEQLLHLPLKQLAAVPNFVIGRKGFGYITFNYDVDLTAFVDDMKNQLFGKVVVFHPTKTVEVYPDESEKPPIGGGLNVPATITLENIYPVDKRSKKPLKDASKFDEIQILVKRLRNMRNMDFISYNPFGGVWTFKVNHFSIWGLVNEEDVEVDEEAIKRDTKKQIKNRSISFPKQKRKLAQSNGGPQESVPGTFILPNAIVADSTQNNLLTLQQQSEPALIEEFDEKEEPLDFLVEEKPYEPDVSEEDFEGLEVDPSLNISSDWVEQLKLAGASLRTVFAASKNLKSPASDEISMLFQEFTKEMALEKSIKKARRLASTNFATFSCRSTLLMKACNSKLGVKEYSLPSSLHKDLALMESLFSKHLDLSIIEARDSNGYPRIFGNSLQFKDVAELFNKSSPDYHVWKLCSVLFDVLDLPYHVENTEARDALLKKKRHHLLCDWIVEQTRGEIEAKIGKTTNSLYLIFLYLAKNDVVSASKIAMKSKNGHLATLITFLGSNDPRVRDLANQQLDKWGSCGNKVDTFIAHIYQLLSGEFLNGKIKTKNTFDEFSWLSLFGLTIYYGKIDECSLEELVEIYLKAHKSNDEFLYVIFKLFSAQNSAENLLKEVKLTKSTLKSAFPWYFAQILRFNNLTKISDTISDKLTSDFIGQLRIAKLPKEALFAACFLSDDFSAKKEVDSIVNHEISTLANTSDGNILERLKIPTKVIYQSKALGDKYNGDFLSEVQNLLKAGSFKEAENVIVTIAAPKLILRSTLMGVEELVLLRKILSQFPKQEMEHWAVGLGVYDSYLALILDSDESEQLLNSLLIGLTLLFERNKHHKEIPACCNRMSQNLISIFLKRYQDKLDSPYKSKLLKLPLGQPEKAYLQSTLTGIE